MFVMVHYVKGADCEEILCGEYGSFEHVLFLLFFIFFFFKKNL